MWRRAIVVVPLLVGCKKAQDEPREPPVPPVTTPAAETPPPPAPTRKVEQTDIDLVFSGAVESTLKGTRDMCGLAIRSADWGVTAPSFTFTAAMVGEAAAAHPSFVLDQEAPTRAHWALGEKEVPPGAATISADRKSMAIDVTLHPTAGAGKDVHVKGKVDCIPGQ